MASGLETIPRDILRHIAFLCDSSSTFEPPTAIFNLLQTSSIIYQSLSVASTPDLYAHIFYTKFDTKATFRRYRERMPDSALAAELVRRCQLLRRSSRLDFTPNHLLQDLWAGLWMFLEDEGLNRQQLITANFHNFVLGLARHVFADPNQDFNSDTLGHIIIWLLCLFLDMSKEDRKELYSLIFPYIFLTSKKTTEPRVHATLFRPSLLSGLENGRGGNSLDQHLCGTHDRNQVYTYHREQNPSVPDPSTAAINLAFVNLEATPVKVPYHLPDTRTIATANQVSGPTKEDYYSLASYRTPLPSDTDHDSVLVQTPFFPKGSRRYDVDFGGHLRTFDDHGRSDSFEYIPGTMTGLWEGVFRTVDAPDRGPNSCVNLDPLLSAAMLKPMQCQLVEYVCLGGTFLHNQLKKTEDSVSEPARIVVSNDCEIIADGWTYRKYVPLADTSRRPARKPRSSYDVILLGETLTDHDQAWGAFRFSGRIHSSGYLLLKRESKQEDGDQGVWIFEGHLQRGVVVLGRWRITGSLHSLDHGIFSLGKVFDKLHP